MNSTDASRLRAIRGPITIVTVGVLFALNNFTTYNFGKTWPVILIVFGLLSLLCRTAPGPPPPPRYPYNPPPYPPAPGAYNAPPQGVYNAPPAGAAGRGGFGTSAPARAADPVQSGPPPGPGGTS